MKFPKKNGLRFLKYNSGLYIGYIGMGKAEMRMANVIYDDTRLEHYEKTLVLFFEREQKKTIIRLLSRAQRSSITGKFHAHLYQHPRCDCRFVHCCILL